MAAEMGVATVDFDQCAVGLRNPDGAPIEPRTCLRTHNPSIVATFSAHQCHCGPGVKHTALLGSNLGVHLSRCAQVCTKTLRVGRWAALE